MQSSVLTACIITTEARTTFTNNELIVPNLLMCGESSGKQAAHSSALNTANLPTPPRQSVPKHSNFQTRRRTFAARSLLLRPIIYILRGDRTLVPSSIADDSFIAHAACCPVRSHPPPLPLPSPEKGAQGTSSVAYPPRCG